MLVMIINLLPQDNVPAGLRAIKILAIPIIPLTMSMVTTVAVIYKKYAHFKRAQKLQWNIRNKSTDESIINETTPILSNGSTTIWKSPPTENDLPSSTQNE